MQFSKEDAQQTFVLGKTCLRLVEDVFSVIFFCLLRRLQDVFKTCLQDIFLKTSSRRLEHVSKTSWKMKNCYIEDVL